MQYEEDEDALSTLVELLDCVKVNDSNFNINCCYEYFNSHSQSVSSVSEAIKQYEFVILTLKTLVKENQLTFISPIYLNELISYIETAESIMDWVSVLETSMYFPPRVYYLNTLKYELVQYNVTSNAYVLLLKCMTFHELQVSKAMEVAFYFFSNCFDRSISISPQIKWKFFGNPYISITWILVVQKYTMDSFTNYRRKLVNEFWNDYYGGSDWRLGQSKTSNLMDYMKIFTRSKRSKSEEKNSFKRFISRSSSFFEIDDTIFAKFSDDKDTSRRRYCLCSIWCFLSILCFLLVMWVYLHYRS